MKSKLRWIWIILISTFLYVFGTLVDTYQIIQIPIYTKIFLTTRNGIFFGMFFVTVGAFLSNIKADIKINICMLFLGIIMLVIESIYLNEKIHIIIVNMNVSSILIAPFLISLAINCKKIEDNKGYNKTFRNLSTIIFCSHPIIILVIEKLSKYISIDLYFAIILVLIFSITVSYLCYRLSNKVKILQSLY